MDATSDSTTQLKQCTKCKEHYPPTTEYFPCDRQKPSGLSFWCKGCRAANKKAGTLHNELQIKGLMKENPDYPRQYHAKTGGMKECSRCRSVLLATTEHFYAHYQKADGLRPECRNCTNEYRASFKEANPEHVKSQRKSYRRKHRESEKRYRENHREYYLNYLRNYAVKNSEKQVARAKAWTAAHPEQARLKGRISQSLRRARKRQAGGSFNSQDIKNLYEEQCELCAYCGIRLHGTFDIDHVVPLKQGGSSAIDNLLLACRSCNVRKHARTPQQWEAVRGW